MLGGEADAAPGERRKEGSVACSYQPTDPHFCGPRITSGEGMPANMVGDTFPYGINSKLGSISNIKIYILGVKLGLGDSLLKYIGLIK